MLSEKFKLLYTEEQLAALAVVRTALLANPNALKPVEASNAGVQESNETKDGSGPTSSA